MKKLGLVLLPAILLTGCASAEPAADPAPVETATSAATPAPEAAPSPTLPVLTSEQLSTLQSNLRAIDPAATEGSFDKAQAVCLQIADGAHGEGFYRGVTIRFDVEDQSKGPALVDAIQSAGVCG